MFITWIRGQRNRIKRPSCLCSEFKQKYYIQAVCFSLRGNRQPSLPRLGPGRTPVSGIPTITIGHRNNWTKLYNITPPPPRRRRGGHNNHYCSYYTDGTHPHCCAHTRV